MKIDASLRLSTGQYKPQRVTKSLIVLHHTVGGSARSTFDWWRTGDKSAVATAYIIDRDGTVFETFDPACWAWHLGVGADGYHDARSIGIELASEGGLRRGPDGALYCFDRISPRTKHTSAHFDVGMNWRGYRHFDAYEPAQLTACFELVTTIMSRFGIPARTPARHHDFNRQLLAQAPHYDGIVSHAQLRADKSDVHPGFPWAELIATCKLTAIDP